MDAHVNIGDVLLSKYRVERVLGQGGMGIVVAARHVELGQQYAIKFLLATMLNHGESRERFLREARAAAQLKSEHVARVHDVGRMPNGAPYMVMEHLDGCDLKVYLSQRGPLPVEEVVTFVLDACDAISEAHALKIVHRDLKPANLFLVRRRNGTPCVKVLDFGISKHVGPDEVDLTNTNMALGSPLYMSPEQMAKTKTVDARTDIWALGVIAYELLAGSSPFRGGSMLEVAAKVLQEEPRSLREVRPDAPERLVLAIERCMRKRREERWATVEEFALVLEEFVPRAPAARSSLASVTNEGIVAKSVVTGAIGAAMGEPTTLTFGQTGKRSEVRRSRIAVVGGLVGVGVVLGLGMSVLGALWVASRGSSTEKEKPTLAVSTETSSLLDAAASTPAPPPEPHASIFVAPHVDVPASQQVRVDEPRETPRSLSVPAKLKTSATHSAASPEPTAISQVPTTPKPNPATKSQPLAVPVPTVPSGRSID